ncbi:MAG: sensor histidine kinase [Anaerolineae bacterium]|jgi:signal transduction histidine kinase|nr:sensor histidine kinase [Anaerolineae bacterium]
MSNDRQLMHHGLRLMDGAVGGAAAFLAAFLAETLMALLGGPALAFGHRLLAALIAAAIGAILAAWFGRRRRRRLSRMLALSDAWLRGNLALRAADSARDGLGDLARQLDALVETLEEDEQDLERLRESNALLTDQVRALALVEERNRLARELHDTVKQHLFSLTMTAGAVRTKAEMLDAVALGASPVDAERISSIREMTTEMEAAARAAQRETTRLIEDLRPAPLQERGLAAALNDYALLFGAQQHLLVYLDAQCNDRLLPPIVTENLYRIAQEALHNVARHAHATRVDIRLRCGLDRITLALEDNGIGFDTNLTRKGLGISGMQDRMLTLGGVLAVESVPGAGTTVQAELERIPGRDLAQAKPGATDGEGRAAPALFATSTSGTPRPEAWSWLGERLVIPVGQTWPWLPAHQELYLRQPLIEPGAITIKQGRALLGLRRAYVLRAEALAPRAGFTQGEHSLAPRPQNSVIARIARSFSGYSLDIAGDSFELRRMRGVKGRAVLERHEQALAAMQYRGRQMDMWTEVVYDDRSYRLHYKDDSSGGYVLRDGSDRPVMDAQDDRITLMGALPLPLLAMVIARIIDESTVRRAVQA